jgi:prevent-host-death family protein
MVTNKEATMQVNIAEAKAHFSELLRKAMLGEEVVIARGNKPLVRLVPLQATRKGRRQPGSGKDRILEISPDFNELPPDFDEYV